MMGGVRGREDRLELAIFGSPNLSLGAWTEVEDACCWNMLDKARLLTRAFCSSSPLLRRWFCDRVLGLRSELGARVSVFNSGRA